MRYVLLILFAMTCCVVLSGCALLTLPFKLLEFALAVAAKMPKPPPGVFGY